MKKILLFLMAIALFVYIFTPIAPAGTVGAPLRQSYSLGDNWWLSPEVEIISDKDLDSPEVGDVDMDGKWYFLKVSSEIGERTEIYGKIGLSELEGEYKWSDGTKVEVEMDSAFAIAGGGSADIWRDEGRGMAIRLGGEVRWTEPDLDTFKLDGVSSKGTGFNAEVLEWQISVALSKEFDKFIPYAGLKYSDSDIEAKYTYSGTTYDIGSADNDNILGVFAGFNYMVTDTFAISLEGRFLDEQAATIAFHWTGM